MKNMKNTSLIKILLECFIKNILAFIAIIIGLYLTFHATAFLWNAFISALPEVFMYVQSNEYFKYVLAIPLFIISVLSCTMYKISNQRKMSRKDIINLHKCFKRVEIVFIILASMIFSIYLCPDFFSDLDKDFSSFLIFAIFFIYLIITMVTLCVSFFVYYIFNTVTNSTIDENSYCSSFSND